MHRSHSWSKSLKFGLPITPHISRCFQIFPSILLIILSQLKLFFSPALSFSHVVLGRPLALCQGHRLPTKPALHSNCHLWEQNVQVSLNPPERLLSPLTVWPLTPALRLCVQNSEGETEEGGGEDGESVLRVQTGPGGPAGERLKRPLLDGVILQTDFFLTTSQWPDQVVLWAPPSSLRLDFTRPLPGAALCSLPVHTCCHLATKSSFVLVFVTRWNQSTELWPPLPAQAGAPGSLTQTHKHVAASHLISVYGRAVTRWRVHLNDINDRTLETPVSAECVAMIFSLFVKNGTNLQNLTAV